MYYFFQQLKLTKWLFQLLIHFSEVKWGNTSDITIDITNSLKKLDIKNHYCFIYFRFHKGTFKLQCFKFKTSKPSQKDKQNSAQFIKLTLFTPNVLFHVHCWKMAKHTFKILQCSRRKVFKVSLVIFNIMHETVNT